MLLQTKKPAALEDRDLWGESVGTVLKQSEDEIAAEKLRGFCARQVYGFLLNMKRCRQSLQSCC